MAANGEIPSTGDPRVDAALARIWGKYQELDEAVLVLVHLEKRTAELVRTHSELLVEDAEKLAEHDKRLAEHEQWWKRHQIVMAEIEDKLNALIDREMKREAGPEAK